MNAIYELIKKGHDVYYIFLPHVMACLPSDNIICNWLIQVIVGSMQSIAIADVWYILLPHGMV